MDYQQASLDLHKKYKGKIETVGVIKVNNRDDLAVVYSPGVAAASLAIAHDKNLAYDLTFKGRMVAVVSDGSAVLGLGDIGPESALPVMEGKAMLFKQLANVDAFPLCLATQDVDEIVRIVTALAPTFGGVNLEDISAPRCFEIEARLQDIGIPVFHDDQHGTAIVVLAGLINACRVTGKLLRQLNVVINGAGSAGSAIAKLLLALAEDDVLTTEERNNEVVQDVIVCDTKGIIHQGRTDLNSDKAFLAKHTNHKNRMGDLTDALQGADVFIGVSVAGALQPEMIHVMNNEPFIFALANPIPEIMPDVAKQHGARIVATGRSDFPNQINNVLAFPGIFKGALSVRAQKITTTMKRSAVRALVNLVEDPNEDAILPVPLTKEIVPAVADAVARAWNKEF